MASKPQGKAMYVATSSDRSWLGVALSIRSLAREPHPTASVAAMPRTTRKRVGNSKLTFAKQAMYPAAGKGHNV
jgi:hypothetical protein